MGSRGGVRTGVDHVRPARGRRNGAGQHGHIHGGTGKVARYPPRGDGDLGHGGCVLCFRILWPRRGDGDVGHAAHEPAIGAVTGGVDPHGVGVTAGGAGFFRAAYDHPGGGAGVSGVAGARSDPHRPVTPGPGGDRSPPACGWSTREYSPVYARVSVRIGGCPLDDDLRGPHQ